jgi:AcrR family transcriptional regulator
MGLRERKKQETRAALADAALRLARAKGPDNVTVEEIAEAADVSVRTFFNYFPHKEHAIIGRDPETVERAVERIKGAPEGESPLTTMWFVIAELVDVLESDGQLSERGEVIMSSPSLVHQVMTASLDDERRLTAALAERLGEPEGSVRVALLVGSVGAACRVVMGLRKANPDTPVRELLTESFQLLAQGIDHAFGPDDEKGSDV